MSEDQGRPDERNHEAEAAHGQLIAGLLSPMPSPAEPGEGFDGGPRDSAPPPESEVTVRDDFLSQFAGLLEQEGQ